MNAGTNTQKILISTLHLSNFSKPQLKFVYGFSRALICKNPCLPQYCATKLQSCLISKRKQLHKILSGLQTRPISFIFPSVQTICQTKLKKKKVRRFSVSAFSVEMLLMSNTKFLLPLVRLKKFLPHITNVHDHKQLKKVTRNFQNFEILDSKSAHNVCHPEGMSSGRAFKKSLLFIQLCL